MNEPVVAATPTPDEIERANIAAYERVFRKCVDAAARVQECPGINTGAGIRMELAKMFFERFYADQATITQAQKNAEAMIKSMTAVMESRR